MKSHGAPTSATQLFRDLYTRLRLAQSEVSQIVAVTSAVDGEGKTTVALQLARTVAGDLSEAIRVRHTEPVLLVNANPRSDEICDDLGVDPSPGLVQYLSQENSFDECVRRTNSRHLWYMPVGGTEQSLAVLIRSMDRDSVRDDLTGHFHLSVLDLPSILSTTDAEVFCDLADTSLMVARAGATPAPMLQEAVDRVGTERLAGIVLNDRRQELPNWLDRRL